jgi:hypothetical protein
MALRRASIATELLQAAIVDGINSYLREVLLAQGLLDERRLDEWTGPDLDERKHAIAKRIAASWQTAALDEEA